MTEQKTKSVALSRGVSPCGGGDSPPFVKAHQGWGLADFRGEARVEGGLGFEHGAGDGQQAVGDRA